MKCLSFYGLISVVLLTAVSLTASAQRTSPGRAFFGIHQHVSGYAVPSGGLSLEGGQYLLHSYWKAGARALDWNQKVTGAAAPDGDPVLFDHVLWTLSGAWLYRLWGSYGRRLNLYAGGGAFLGLNRYEVFRKLPTELDGEFPAAEFVYGVEPEVDLEVFPFRRTALVLGIQSPFTLSSSLGTDLWHLGGSLGIRFNL